LENRAQNAQSKTHYMNINISNQKSYFLLFTQFSIGNQLSVNK